MIIAWQPRRVRGLFLAAGERRATARPVARVVAGLAVVALVLGSLLYANPLLGIQDVGARGRLLELAAQSRLYAVPALLVADAPSRSARIRRPLAGTPWRWRALALAAPGSRLRARSNCASGSSGSRLGDGSVGSAERHLPARWSGSSTALWRCWSRASSGRRDAAVGRRSSWLLRWRYWGKVFLPTNAAVLTGLYRVASFFGLGVSLMVIGYAYQRRACSRRPGRTAGGQSSTHAILSTLVGRACRRARRR